METWTVFDGDKVGVDITDEVVFVPLVGVARVAMLLELALQIAEKVLARRSNDEPDKGPE